MAYMNGKKILDIVMTGLGLTFFSDKGKRAAGLFQGLSDLKKVPEDLEFLQPISCENMFKDCTVLEEAPMFDTSKSTNFSNMFYKARYIKEIPAYNTSNGTDFSKMLGYNQITRIPEIDTSKGENFFGMFTSSTLYKIPKLNLKNAKNCSYMFNYCSNMDQKEDITLDVGNCQNFAFMFNYCRNMKVAPTMDTSKGRVFAYMFNACTYLVTIPKLNLSNAVEKYYSELIMTINEGLANTFSGCVNLENIKIEGVIYQNISFVDCTKLTHESLMSIINALANHSSATTKHYCRLGSTNLAKLSNEEKAIAIKNNWYLY